MKLIKQRTKKDCLIASFAMASGLTYEQLREYLHPIEANESHGVQEFIDILFFDFNIPYVYMPMDEKNIKIKSDFSCIRLNFCLYYTCVLLLATKHAVAWEPKSEKIYDPLEGIRPPNLTDEVEGIFLKGNEKNELQTKM